MPNSTYIATEIAILSPGIRKFLEHHECKLERIRGRYYCVYGIRRKRINLYRVVEFASDNRCKELSEYLEHLTRVVYPLEWRINRD